MPDELTQLLCDLVAIDSVNPELVPGAAGESRIAAFIAAWLEQAGLEVERLEQVPGRPNVIGIARGTGGGKTLLLNGHVDTVGAAGMLRPFDPVIRDGRLYARGAYDMKGGVAACMAAVKAAKEHPLRGDVIFTAVVDEEYAGAGTMAVAGRHPADGAIVSEFTELRLVPAHKGFVWLEIETTGRAAHGSRPDLGVDAIVKMGPLLMELERLGRELGAHPTHPLLGSGSLHASFIEGGREYSTYPERCLLTLERRTLPGETPERVQAEIQTILTRLHAADPALRATVRLGMDRPPMETPADAGILVAVREAAEQVMGRPVEIAGVPFWTDAATLAAAGIPTLLFGPAGAGAHAAEEWVDLASVRACADVYLATAVKFCA
jgi:acetylornithine deacetylase